MPDKRRFEVRIMPPIDEAPDGLVVLAMTDTASATEIYLAPDETRDLLEKLPRALQLLTAMKYGDVSSTPASPICGAEITHPESGGLTDFGRCCLPPNHAGLHYYKG